MSDQNNFTVTSAMEKRKRGKELDTESVGYFGSGVREEFSERDLFQLRPNNENRPACRVVGGSTSGQGSYCCDSPEHPAR